MSADFFPASSSGRVPSGAVDGIFLEANHSHRQFQPVDGTLKPLIHIKSHRGDLIEFLCFEQAGCDESPRWDFNLNFLLLLRLSRLKASGK